MSAKIPPSQVPSGKRPPVGKPRQQRGSLGTRAVKWLKEHTWIGKKIGAYFQKRHSKAIDKELQEKRPIDKLPEKVPIKARWLVGDLISGRDALVQTHAASQLLGRSLSSKEMQVFKELRKEELQEVEHLNTALKKLSEKNDQLLKEGKSLEEDKVLFEKCQKIHPEVFLLMYTEATQGAAQRREVATLMEQVGTFIGEGNKVYEKEVYTLMKQEPKVRDFFRNLLKILEEGKKTLATASPLSSTVPSRANSRSKGVLSWFSRKLAEPVVSELSPSHKILQRVTGLQADILGDIIERHPKSLDTFQVLFHEMVEQVVFTNSQVLEEPLKRFALEKGAKVTKQGAVERLNAREKESREKGEALMSKLSKERGELARGGGGGGKLDRIKKQEAYATLLQQGFRKRGQRKHVLEHVSIDNAQQQGDLFVSATFKVQFFHERTGKISKAEIPINAEDWGGKPALTYDEFSAKIGKSLPQLEEASSEALQEVCHPKPGDTRLWEGILESTEL